MRGVLLLTGLAAALVLAIPAVGAAPSSIQPPTAKVDGADLTQWTKRYFVFDAAIPVVDGSHPALDEGDVDCGIGQFSKRVWFLETAPSLVGDFERRCTVPKGATLYVPLLQWFCSPAFDGQPIPECMEDPPHHLVDIKLRVDGVELEGAALDAYRVIVPEFELPLVENSFWEFLFDMELPDSIPFAVDAFGAFVGPFRNGEHEIEVSVFSEEFGLDGTLVYKLKVEPFKKG